MPNIKCNNDSYAICYLGISIPAVVQSGQELPCPLKPFQCWNRIVKAFANSLDPDETPQNVASHQDPNCLVF
ncbi:hypothetical protein DPMN_025444 [Dreissena polymorpha]|uniref:Uncharacterized protein n=1 Tax=Dreissena polymorpha TaxID=45954 RepID=A0A9D4LPB0_DREPO|nr:hypothetical protein DPMN_025444 [Dreissena polymorpha]